MHVSGPAGRQARFLQARSHHHTHSHCPILHLCERKRLTRRTSTPSGRRHSASLDTLSEYSCRWLVAVCSKAGQQGRRTDQVRVRQIPYSPPLPEPATAPPLPLLAGPAHRRCRSKN